MILHCGKCDRHFDAAGVEPRSVVRCECGDLLMVPDPEQLEAANVIPQYLERWAQEFGKSAESFQAGDGWEFIAGSAMIRIEHDAVEQTFSVESVLLPVPDNERRRLDLYSRLLELNYRRTGEARFAVQSDQVVVTFSRPTLGLDYLEFQRAVDEVARAADDYDDELTAEFGDATVGEE